MKAFLKRWHAEFKKEREIRQNTLLPTMPIEAYKLDLSNKKSTNMFDMNLFNAMTYGDEYKNSDY